MQATAATTISPEAYRALDNEAFPFTVRRCTPTIGADVEGIDFREPLDEENYLSLRRALLKYKVLFFRKQAITPAQHVAVARRFGELEVHPMLTNHPEHPELVVFGRDGKTRGRENLYHSDVTWREVPSMGSMLRCLECPEVGGDTIWINMAAAYENLPEDMKARIANLKAVHDAMPTFGSALNEAKYAEMRAKFPPMVHPVVRTHPETGEKILFVNEAFTTHFANFAKEQPYRIGSDYRPAELDMMQYLYRQAAAPEYQVRLRWQPDTIALWDNRSTQHYAVQDYFPAVRHMNRATIIGDRPV
ncbi:alpha-ketoglutarate-dependent taurine dioxygenase TauD [Cupriavidus necator N-1]|jgi:taurine dioxygenase|uniref:Alpha-ketoglutarate-dependent taurine dioxygenase TauD n=1 Tax=Cupriavidus necator (strain ATCC 43291 / DSM 13513 / CCUG 52238 / LMG 8453 / N-1) TaxID=1042878 RepID=F8GPC6_CUPNN|nr:MULTISPECIES: TauD/TfdA family dioxygenase [Cupriavidus]AEI80494.1 alpha-ketoglutarate-dependent taurine dioxygenase TauD [Cupriavidus necator N-1]KAI3595474.1 dioxygenase, TauD/TfdA family [Cupriavidus necator H850]MDX6009879.1 TauD/TfdA family dioxygenase [Cupriavidus necator]QUN30712.1 TauD/TfdA family dioxygenase [Cupriavidus sp. KK10]